MTEYDFSPEAYERHLAKQAQIGRWVNRTDMFQAELKNPFTPATPAVRAVELDQALARKGVTQEEPYLVRDRYVDKVRERDKERDRVKETEREKDKGRSHRRSKSHGHQGERRERVRSREREKDSKSRHRSSRDDDYYSGSSNKHIHSDSTHSLPHRSSSHSRRPSNASGYASHTSLPAAMPPQQSQKLHAQPALALTAARPSASRSRTNPHPLSHQINPYPQQPAPPPPVRSNTMPMIPSSVPAPMHPTPQQSYSPQPNLPFGQNYDPRRIGGQGYVLLPAKGGSLTVVVSHWSIFILRNLRSLTRRFCFSLV